MKFSGRQRLLILAGALILAVVAYNTWSYCCGHCTVKVFFTLGPAGALLLSLNVAAGSILLLLNRRNRQRFRHLRCSCGWLRASDWAFCPGCGAKVE